MTSDETHAARIEAQLRMLDDDDQEDDVEEGSDQ